MDNHYCYTDGMEKKMKAAAKHVDACHKGCKEVHVMCDWKGCAAQGKHFAQDHVSVYAK